ncbi:hypothetical protein O9929_17440 [Vibrio lentus]|nr:hypothetical protein [Vibrio lentus]
MESKNCGTLNAETPVQKYELAVSLLPSSYSSVELATIKAKLQDAYLDAEQADNIAVRKQQVAQQQQTVMTYHDQLDQLKSSFRPSTLCKSCQLGYSGMEQLLSTTSN